MNKRLNDILVPVILIVFVGTGYGMFGQMIPLWLGAAILGITFIILIKVDQERKKIFQNLPDDTGEKCAYCHNHFNGEKSYTLSSAAGILTAAHEGQRFHKGCIRRLKKELIRRR